MPVYVYECIICGAHFELKQGFTEPPVDACPRCQGKVRRVFQPAPVIFKGSGFYITDCRPPVKEDSKDSKDSKGSKDSQPASTGKTTQDKGK